MKTEGGRKVIQIHEKVKSSQRGLAKRSEKRERDPG